MKKILSVSLSLLLLLLLVSCQDVFNSSISGTVLDADTGEAIRGIEVYGYTSQSERDKALDNWDGKSDFRDSSCLYRASTDNQGKWTISKVVWATNDSQWGKDYDHTPFYLLYFSEEYGLEKSSASIEIVSSASNNNAVTERLRKKMNSYNLTLRFDEVVGSSNKLIADTLTFDYEYNNGYKDIKKKATVTNGEITLNLSLMSDTDITIKNLSDNEKCFSPVVDFTVNTNEKSKVTTLARTNYYLGSSGLSGRVQGKNSDIGGICVKLFTYEIENNQEVNKKEIASVLTSATTPSSPNTDNPKYYYATFEGLGSGLTIGKDSQAKLVVSYGTPEIEKKIYLSDSYSNIVINLD